MPKIALLLECEMFGEVDGDRDALWTCADLESYLGREPNLADSSELS